MKKISCISGILGMALLAGALDGHCADWVKNSFDVPNKNVEANYHDASSVKGLHKTISWTEKTVLTDFGAKYYTKHLSSFPECQKNIAQKGEVTQHQIDFEIKEGKFRAIAKRNYNKANELICTDKDTTKEFDMSWKTIPRNSPMAFREYEFVSKYKLGNI